MATVVARESGGGSGHNGACGSNGGDMVVVPIVAEVVGCNGERDGCGINSSGNCSCRDKNGHTPTFHVTNFLLRHNVMCNTIPSEHNNGVQEDAEKSPSLKNKHKV